MDFGSVRAALGTGEHLAALGPFSVLTSLLVVDGFILARGFTRIGEARAEISRLEGFTLVREFPLGNSLLRTVLFDCSNGFACILRLGEGREMGTTVSGDNLKNCGLDPSVRGLRAS